MNEALKHSNACRELLDDERLADAIAYCSAQRVEPPQCSLTADSVNADRLRNLAKNMLSDYGWWLKRLKIRAAREAETVRIRQGLSSLK
ncbi:hypothetical protein [Massilia cavernae]|uniref:hypothetical protein n=1 Tax=Massilia cavernae TaxID=2320864 RepID=UPI0011C3B9E0|nr:hypothetical protein [Massilia cavernae]